MFLEEKSFAPKKEKGIKLDGDYDPEENTDEGLNQEQNDLKLAKLKDTLKFMDSFT